MLARGAMLAAAALATIVTRRAQAGPKPESLASRARVISALRTSRTPARPTLIHELSVREEDGSVVHFAVALPLAVNARGEPLNGEEQNAYGAVQMNLATIGGSPISSSLYDSGNTALKVNCITGCSATSGFTDNSAYTVSTSTINVVGAYYTSGAAPSISSGNAGRVRMDASSFLMVNCQVGCSGSAGFADNAAFTAGTTTINVSGGWYSTAPTNCTSGSACAPQLTQDRKLCVQDFQGTSPWVVSANGGSFAVTQSGTWNVNASQSGTWTVQPGNTANTTPWLVTGTGGTFPVTGTFWQATQPVSIAGNQAVNMAQWAGSNLGAMANYGTSPGAVLVPGVNAFITNTPNVNIQSDATINVDKIAGSSVVADPCQTNARSSANINLTAGGQVIAGTASKQTYICSLDLVSATAQNIALVEGTGTTCATSTAGMAGGTTAATGWNLSANGGLVKGVGSNWVFKTATAADNVCLLLSGTGQTSGSIQYVQQ